jgi:hypothetical protein
VTYYTGLGGSRSSSGRSPSPTQLEKELRFESLHAQLKALLEVHHVDFPAAKPPVAPEPPPVDKKAFVSARKKQELAGIPFWKLGLRKDAKKRAAELAEEDVEVERERVVAERFQRQAELDERWKRLTNNDPETVISAIEEAFEDNEAPATPVDVEDDVLSLVMMAPGEDAVPDKKPALTPSGNPTVKRMNKTETADAYVTLVFGHLLATVKEALACAPEIDQVKTVVVRRTPKDIYGRQHLEALFAATYDRKNMERIQWKDALAPEIAIEGGQDVLVQLKGRAKTLQPLDLTREAQLVSLLEVLDGVGTESRSDEGGLGPASEDLMDLDAMGFE